MLEILLKKQPCPWCGENLSLSMPGARRTEHKWHGIPIYASTVRVCPYCNHSILLDKKSKRWLLLSFPLLGLMLWRAWTLDHWTQWLQNTGPLEWAAVLLTAVGAVMQSATEHYEKAE